MNKKLLTFSILAILLCGNIRTSMAQNNPYVDDKLLHFGFFVGVDLLSYHIQENDDPTQMGLPGFDGHVYHPRTMAIGPGFQVGFITDLRLNRCLNLRFSPALHFGERTITYTSYTLADSLIRGVNCPNNRPNLLTIPITIPLYLKWSAPRINNYRPYVIVGGGVEFECFRDKDKPILHKPFDAFVSAGFGCDFYFRWFKLCPEIKYQIGFVDAHVPISAAEDNDWGVAGGDYFYTNAIKRMTHQKLSIVFNFE